jgi:hypothetical protein
MAGERQSPKRSALASCKAISPHYGTRNTTFLHSQYDLLGLAFLPGLLYAVGMKREFQQLGGATLNPSNKRLLFDLPGRYRIRVGGRLGASWADRLGEMAITVRQVANQQPVTTLTGEVIDQAALMGVLNALYDMGFPLLKVERLGPPPSAEGLSR